MDAALHDQLEAVFRAIQILSPEAIRIHDEAPVAVQERGLWPQHAPAQEPPATPLLATLLDLLYARFYSRPPHAWPPAERAATAEEELAFRRRLSSANQCHECWDSGWRVTGVEPNGVIRVRKDDRLRTAMPGEYLFAEATGMAPRAGHSVTLYVPKETALMMPGFFFVFGDTLASHADEFHSSRIYFHCTAAGAPILLEYLTRELNRFQVPFRFKCMNSLGDYLRTDAAVVYVAARYFPFVAAIVADLPDDVTSQLKPEVPLFSQRLRAGVGAADDPLFGQSFGRHRCRFLAEGIIEAWQSGQQDVEARLAAVRRKFTEHGLDLDRPHLNPGNVDFYALPEVGGLDAIEGANAIEAAAQESPR